MLTQVGLFTPVAFQAKMNAVSEAAAMHKTGDLETILDNTSFLLSHCTRDLHYRYVTRAYAAMLGRSPDEIRGKPLIDIMGPVGFETIRPYVERVLQGERVEYEAEVDLPTIGPREYHVLYMPERNEQNQVVGWIASITDITEQKKAAMEKERLEKQLTHLMRIGTLDGLSGAIAHELSQPLTSILANAQAAHAELAAKTPRMEAVAEILKDIIQDDLRAGRVIANIRKLFRKAEERSERINLNDLLLSTLELLHSEVVNRKIKVDTALNAALPLILGNSVELQQVLINLIMNSIEAMASTPASERMLSFTTEEKADGCVEVSIRDRGSGIPPDQLERIFEPFFTTKSGGLGLGLSICSSIVKSHGGQITLRNASEGGTIAIISIPKNALSPTVP